MVDRMYGVWIGERSVDLPDRQWRTDAPRWNRHQVPMIRSRPQAGWTMGDHHHTAQGTETDRVVAWPILENARYFNSLVSRLVNSADGFRK